MAALVDAPVGVGRLVEVLQGALGVVELRLDVVACTTAKPIQEPRRIQLEACTDHPTSFVVIGATGNGVLGLSLGPDSKSD